MLVITRISCAALLVFDFGAGLVTPLGWLHLVIGVIAVPAALYGAVDQGRNGQLPSPRDAFVTPALTMQVLRERRQERR